MSTPKLAGDPGAIPPEGRRGLAEIGWMSAGVALLAAGSIFIIPDEAGVLVLLIVLFGGNAVWFIGPPIGREGRPSAIAIRVVFLGACAGLVFTVAVDLLIAVGVVYLSLVIGILAGARWRPPERAGAIWSLAGTIPAFLAVVAVIVREINSDVMRFGLVAVVVAVVTRLWATTVGAYSARGERG